MEKLSIAKQKWIRSLHHKKYREKYGYFIGEGEKLFREILLFPEWLPKYVIASGPWWEAHKGEAQAIPDQDRYEITPADLKQISALTTPQEPLMVLSMPVPEEKIVIQNQSVVLYLDGIRDPGNLGTILRLSDWFGYHNLALSADTVDWTNPKTVQASMGSFLRVRIIQGELIELMKGPLSGRRLLGASMSGTPIDMITPGESVLVIGNESHGLREEVQSFLDEQVTIPGEGSAESLNAAIAAAICCYQFHVMEKK